MDCSRQWYLFRSMDLINLHCVFYNPVCGNNLTEWPLKGKIFSRCLIFSELLILWEQTFINNRWPCLPVWFIALRLFVVDCCSQVLQSGEVLWLVALHTIFPWCFQWWCCLGAYCMIYNLLMEPALLQFKSILLMLPCSTSGKYIWDFLSLKRRFYGPIILA